MSTGLIPFLGGLPLLISRSHLKSSFGSSPPTGLPPPGLPPKHTTFQVRRFQEQTAEYLRNLSKKGILHNFFSCLLYTSLPSKMGKCSIGFCSPFYLYPFLDSLTFPFCCIKNLGSQSLRKRMELLSIPSSSNEPSYCQ